VPTFYKLAYEQFEGRVRIHSATNTKGTTNIDPQNFSGGQSYFRSLPMRNSAAARMGPSNG
jgi:hypothetical protein